jgi:hypothetical protein
MFTLSTKSTSHLKFIFPLHNQNNLRIKDIKYGANELYPEDAIVHTLADEFYP